MTDPYKVLGVSPNSSDEQIKSAYRELARKYHPDSYANNPLADLANEKMQEINEAYDTVVNQRKNQGSSQGGYGTSNSGGYNSYSYGTGQFDDVRRLISQNRITEAEEILDGVSGGKRDAEWYFLKGSIFYTRGWINEAYNYYQKASGMNPSNQEYRRALAQLDWQRKTATPAGGTGYRTGGNVGCSGCNICTTLLCADCCCECLGGDIISCC